MLTHASPRVLLSWLGKLKRSNSPTELAKKNYWELTGMGKLGHNQGYYHIEKVLHPFPPYRQIHANMETYLQPIPMSKSPISQSAERRGKAQFRPPLNSPHNKIGAKISDKIVERAIQAKVLAHQMFRKYAAGFQKPSPSACLPTKQLTLSMSQSLL